MSQIPAPLLSRHLGILVIVLSVLAAAGIVAMPWFGDASLYVALALIIVQQAFLALAVLVLGRTGLAGPHSRFAVVATLGAAGILLLDALAEIAVAIAVAVRYVPDADAIVVILAIGGTLVALTALLLILFGVAVLRARVVRQPVRVLPLVAGLAVVAAVAVSVVDRPTGLFLAPAAAVLLSGGIGLALFTRRTLK